MGQKADTAPPLAASPAQRKALDKLGLRRDIDLALHLPLRHEDETRIIRLADAREGETAQIEAVVLDCEVVYRPRRQLLALVAEDGEGGAQGERCQLRFFNFYPSLQKTLSVGARLRLRGELRGGLLGWQMMHPVVRSAATPLPAALTPVYPTVAGLAQPYLRRAVQGGLARARAAGLLAETIAPALAAAAPRPCLPSLADALDILHNPPAGQSLAQLDDRSHPARQRLKAEELLAQQLAQSESRRERARLRAPVLTGVAGALHDRLLAALPFALTRAQRRVGEEIARDLARPAGAEAGGAPGAVPMHRLLQGDVGSGKTVVAALAAARCIDAGHQCALMAPTEILAEQHFRKLIGWLEPLGVRVAWLTGSLKTRDKRAMLTAVESGDAGLVVGTHAVIQKGVQFRRLALAIIDEQHRFGVQQRLALRAKMSGPDGVRAQLEPHLLMMSATPIPRTLAMSYYADLDVSTLDELPPGRSPIVTKLVSDSRRDEVIERIRAQIAQGRQVYWVCPLIEESEALDLVNATATHQALCEALPGVKVGLLHSRMKPADKQAVMSLFSAGQMALLVSTTVIEVGVDVPNATLMVVEHAERFGLSQLHQLRGRVGRGAAASACVLLYAGGALGAGARARLRAMIETADGFEIARRDLEIRGPGEFLGERQSGAPLLRFADLATDVDWLEWARTAAPRLLAAHPDLARLHLERWLGGKSDYLKA